MWNLGIEVDRAVIPLPGVKRKGDDGEGCLSFQALIKSLQRASWDGPMEGWVALISVHPCLPQQKA